jgi:hypothetical protein
MATPPTLYRVSFFYQQKGDRTAGWTTNLYNDASDDATIIARGRKLAALLNKLAGKGCSVVKFRYAQTPAFRVADEVLLTYSSALAAAGSQLNADYPNTAVGVVLIGAGKYKVNIWLSGNDDSAVIDAGRLSDSFRTDPDWAALQTYLLKGGDGWVMRCKNKSRPSKPVTGITAAGTVNCPGHGFDGTNTVVISRIKGIGRPRGSYRITNITTNTFDLANYTGSAMPPLVGRFAQAREDIYIAVAIAGTMSKRATSHKRGKPIDLLSGKSKKPV